MTLGTRFLHSVLKADFCCNKMRKSRSGSKNSCQNSGQNRISFAGADVLNDTSVYDFNLTTTKSGNSAVCEAVGVAPGVYDITALSEHTLMNVRRNVVILAPNTSVDLGTLLEGDANQDNIVNLDDYAILSMCWRASEAQAEYDTRTDFDRNGLINMADLSLFAANWLWNSPVEVSP